MAGMVWVRSEGDDGALLFPLRERKHLLLNSVATHWKLDPATLRVGQLVLSPDANHSSVSSIDEIRAYSSIAGFGDGLTQQSPLIISGSPANPRHEQQHSPKPLPEKVAAAAVELSEFRKLHFVQRRELYPLRRLLQDEQRDTMMKELVYDESGLHHYSTQISTQEAMGEAVGAFVGEVYVDGVATGLVTLVKPQGTFVTAWDCLKGFKEGKSKLQVKLPRLTGETLYDCRVLETLDLVVHLESVERQSFKSCIIVRPQCVGYFVFDGMESMKLVSCMEVEHTGLEVLILPVAEVKPRSAIGGPVLNHCGELKGVVVDAFKFLKKAGSRSAKRCKTRRGRDIKVQSVLDLEDCRKYAEDWKFAGSGGLRRFEDWTNGLQLRRLIEYMPPFVKPSFDEWFEQNPLTKFVDKVVEKVCKPGFKFKTRHLGRTGRVANRLSHLLPSV